MLSASLVGDIIPASLLDGMISASLVGGMISASLLCCMLSASGGGGVFHFYYPPALRALRATTHPWNGVHRM
jgi:hypothetical protein